MRHHHTLRPPRRPRRINHIRRMRHQQPTQPIPINQILRRKPIQTTRQTTLQHHHRLSIRQHKLNPLHRIIRIHRQIRPTRLHHRQLSHHNLHRPRQHQRHHTLRTNPTPHQPPRQPIRPTIQLRIRQHQITTHHRHRIRPPNHLRLKQLPQRHRRNITPNTTPLPKHTPPLKHRQDVHLAEANLRVGSHRAEEPHQPTGELLRALPVKQIPGIFDAALDPGRRAVAVKRLGQLEGEVELGGLEPERLRGDL